MTLPTVIQIRDRPRSTNQELCELAGEERVCGDTYGRVEGCRVYEISSYLEPPRFCIIYHL